MAEDLDSRAPHGSKPEGADGHQEDAYEHVHHGHADGSSYGIHNELDGAEQRLAGCGLELVVPRDGGEGGSHTPKKHGNRAEIAREIGGDEGSFGGLSVARLYAMREGLCGLRERRVSTGEEDARALAQEEDGATEAMVK